MIKKIKIGENEYEINSNAYTRFLYKKVFGNSIIDDLNPLIEFAEKTRQKTEELEKLGIKEEELNTQIGLFVMRLPEFDNYMETIYKMAYIFIKTQDEAFMDFESWLKTIDKVSLSDKWVTEVTELAVSSFYR